MSGYKRPCKAENARRLLKDVSRGMTLRRGWGGLKDSRDYEGAEDVRKNDDIWRPHNTIFLIIQGCKEAIQEAKWSTYRHLLPIHILCLSNLHLKHCRICITVTSDMCLICSIPSLPYSWTSVYASSFQTCIHPACTHWWMPRPTFFFSIRG